MPFSEIDLSHVAADALAESLSAAASSVQASLDLSAGPLWRVVLFDLGLQRRQRLLIVIHHLVVDTVAWRVLLEDLQTLVEQPRDGAPVQLPAKTTSYRKWAMRLSAHAASNALQDQIAYWHGLPWDRVVALPVDHDYGLQTVSTEQHVVASPSEDETRALLQDVPAAYRTQINDVLLAALAHALAQWTGGGLVAVELESHGREDLFDDVDTSRTVGWFTSAFPLVLDTQSASGEGELLCAVKEQLRKVPTAASASESCVPAAAWPRCPCRKWDSTILVSSIGIWRPRGLSVRLERARASPETRPASGCTCWT